MIGNKYNLTVTTFQCLHDNNILSGKISMRLHAKYGVWQVDSIFALLSGRSGDRNNL